MEEDQLGHTWTIPWNDSNVLRAFDLLQNDFPEMIDDTVAATLRFDQCSMTPPSNWSCKAAPNALQASEVTPRNTDRTNLYKSTTSTREHVCSTRPQCGLCQHEAGNFWMCHIREASKLSICRLILRLGLSIPPYYIIYHHLSSIHVRFCSRLSVNGLGAADPRAFISLARETLHWLLDLKCHQVYNVENDWWYSCWIVMRSQMATNGQRWSAKLIGLLWNQSKNLKILGFGFVQDFGARDMNMRAPVPHLFCCALRAGTKHRLPMLKESSQA